MNYEYAEPFLEIDFTTGNKVHSSSYLMTTECET